MQVSVAFRQMDASPALQQYAADKLLHVVQKYVQGQDVDTQVVFSVEKFRHIVNFTVNVNGLTVKSVEKTEDMYSSVDLALDKIERQMRRYKDKIRRHKPDNRRASFTMEVLALNAEDVDEAHEREEEEQAIQAAPAAEETAAPITVTSLKKEEFTAPFMSPEEAIMQLELLGGQFFVFTHHKNEQINIIYRREDGHFGLIEPAAAQH